MTEQNFVIYVEGLKLARKTASGIARLNAGAGSFARGGGAIFVLLPVFCLSSLPS